MKNKIAKILDLLFINNIVWFIFHCIYGKNYIRVVNYHSTNKIDITNFEKQLKFFRLKYKNTSFNELELFIKTKKWNKQKPGIIISFDDGFRTNFDYAKPLLEKYNFTGYFFIPSDFIFENKETQDNYMFKNNTKKEGDYIDGRYSMTWEEVIELSKNHIIGSHTKTHYRFKEKDTDDILYEQIVKSKENIENKLNATVDSFAWVGGEFHTYTPKAFELIKKTYKYSFMTNTFPVLPNSSPFFIERTNIESYNPIHLVKFQLSGLMDLYYYRKRKKLRNKISIT